MTNRRQRKAREASFLEHVRDLLHALSNELVEVKTYVKALQTPHNAVHEYPCHGFAEDQPYNSFFDLGHSHFKETSSIHHDHNNVSETVLSYLNPHAPPFNPAISRSTFLRFRASTTREASPPPIMPFKVVTRTFEASNQADICSTTSCVLEKLPEPHVACGLSVQDEVELEEPIEFVETAASESTWCYDEPKIPDSAYLLYVRDNRSFIDATSPAETCRALNSGWKNLESTARKKYEAEALESMEIYKVQHTEYFEQGRYRKLTALRTGDRSPARSPPSCEETRSSVERWGHEEAVTWFSATLDNVLQAKPENRASALQEAWEANQHRLDPALHEPLKQMIFQKTEIQL